jgi:hypothetical protein
MGYSQIELDDVQAKWNFRFPPDLIELLRERRPLVNDPQCFDWIAAEPKLIKYWFDWPFEGYWKTVQRRGIWWPEWGERPRRFGEQREKLRAIFADAPTLVPLVAHRFIPDEPSEPGNPVFSVFHSDIVHYGANLRDWLTREFRTLGGGLPPWPPIKEIRFWGDAVRHFADQSRMLPGWPSAHSKGSTAR